jgi:trehalose-6-phosphate synthase
MLAKHVQFIWSNLSDLFYLIIESKYVKTGKEKFGEVFSNFKDSKEFFWTFFHHILKEIFYDDSIFDFFRTYSYWFLEGLCLILKQAQKNFSCNLILAGKVA